MDRKSEQIFFQRRNTDSQQAHENMLNISNHQRNANQNHDEITHHICQIGVVTMEDSMEVPQKKKNRTAI